MGVVARYYGEEMENPYKAAQGSMLVWVISFKGLRLATTSGLKPIDLHLACDLAVLSFHDAVREPKFSEVKGR